MAKVLGLDGSLQNFGIALATVDLTTKEIISVDDLVLSKTVKSTDKKMKRADDDYSRFYTQIGAVRQLASDNNVSCMFGEIPSGAQDARASFAFGGVTAILAGFAHDYELKTVTPAEVKVAATGSKNADKEDVIAATYELFPNAPWITGSKPNAMNIKTPEGKYLTNANEHLADAIAVILAGLKK